MLGITKIIKRSHRSEINQKDFKSFGLHISKLKIDKEVNEKGNFDLFKRNVDNIVSMHHSLSEVCKLVDLNISDSNINIISRPDIYIRTSLEEIVLKIQKCELFNSNYPVIYYSSYIYNGKHNRLLLDQKNGGTDCFIVANNHALKILSGLSKDVGKFKIPSKIFAEDSLFNFLYLNNVIFKSLNYSAPFDWDILRFNGFHEKKHIVFLKSIKQHLNNP